MRNKKNPRQKHPVKTNKVDHQMAKYFDSVKDDEDVKKFQARTIKQFSDMEDEEILKNISLSQNILAAKEKHHAENGGYPTLLILHPVASVKLMFENQLEVTVSSNGERQVLGMEIRICGELDEHEAILMKKSK